MITFLLAMLLMTIVVIILSVYVGADYKDKYVKSLAKLSVSERYCETLRRADRQEMADIENYYRAKLKDSHNLSKVSLKEQMDYAKTLRQQLRDIREEVGRILELSSVAFIANVPNKGWMRTEFKLGVGKCGLTVASIQWDETTTHYVLTQRCTTGERKEFIYAKEDIQGRIEKAYRADPSLLDTIINIPQEPQE